MEKGIKSIIYPVKDAAKAKTIFKRLLGVEPYADTAYYVGFKVGDLDIGLDPQGHRDGATAYYYVEDIRKELKLLVESGATVLQDVKTIGGGGLIASVRDADGNIIGLIQ